MQPKQHNIKAKITIEKKLEKKKAETLKLDVSEENKKLVIKYINSLIRDGKSKKTCIALLTSLSKILTSTNFEFSKTTTEDVEDFLDMLEARECESGLNKGQPLSHFTKNNMKTHFKNFLKYIGKDDAANIIHCKNLKGSKLPEDILTKEEVLEIIDHTGSLRDKALFGLLYESGCRVGEILSMKVKNVEFLANGGASVTFPAGKTGARRVLIFNFASYLRQWLDVHPLKDEPDAPLWPTEDYRQTQLSDIGLRGILKKVVSKTTIKKRVWLHGFRHTRATHLSEYMTEQQMKVYLGWTAGSDMPAIYCHLSGRDVDKAVKSMYGIEDNEVIIDPMKPGKCVRCGEMNASGANYCFKCGLPLTSSARQEFEAAKLTAEKLFVQWITENPEKMKRAGDYIKK